MRPSLAGPTLSDVGKVSHVVGNEEPRLGGGQREQLLVGGTVEGPFLGCCANVVTVGAQRIGYGAPRKVRVEEQPQTTALPVHA
jgi:hypothetical protein